jgi:hypothetical protein
MERRDIFIDGYDLLGNSLKDLGEKLKQGI